jgi:subtilisin family serine protease
MCTEGRNAVAYVVDTGVQADHPQFETPSRVVLSLDFSVDRTNQDLPYTTDVTNACTTGQFTTIAHRWHGTAVASVLGGTQVGVAKPLIVSLKIARCHDFNVLVSSLISAVDWIGSNADPYREFPGVINHSGFVPQWTTPNYSDQSAYASAVSGSVTRHQKPFFTSADNFSTDACIFAPNNLARTYANTNGKVISVGGTMMGSVAGTDALKDYRWKVAANTSVTSTGQDGGSNAGQCVSIHAPAHNVYAARRTSLDENPYGRASGTSFSSPIVAGIAARYMAKQHQNTGTIPTYDQVYTWLLNNASATVEDVTTPAYWFCGLENPWNDGTRDRLDRTWLANPPSQCPWPTWGRDWQGSWGPGAPPAYFQSVGNASGARMVYWDEGVCQ